MTDVATRPGNERQAYERRATVPVPYGIASGGSQCVLYALHPEQPSDPATLNVSTKCSWTCPHEDWKVSVYAVTAGSTAARRRARAVSSSMPGEWTLTQSERSCHTCVISKNENILFRGAGSSTLHTDVILALRYH
jgi:hypothetical protein